MEQRLKNREKETEIAEEGFFLFSEESAVVAVCFFHSVGGGMLQGTQKEALRWGESGSSARLRSG